jgi:hypothetical protein
VSLVFLDEDGALLERAAEDKHLALALLAGQYSANAYAFGTRYQNCNQWVAEMLASAWGRARRPGCSRARGANLAARTRLCGRPVKVPSHWMMFAGQFVPLLHVNDHPVDDIHALALRSACRPRSRTSCAAGRRRRSASSCATTGAHRRAPRLGSAGTGLHAGPGDEVIPLDS